MSKFTPESVSKLSDNELKREICLKQWPDLNDVQIDIGGMVYGRFPDRSYRKVGNPLAPTEAFCLMANNRIDIYHSEYAENECIVQAGDRDDPQTVTVEHHASQVGTARAICELYLLMEPK